MAYLEFSHQIRTKLKGDDTMENEELIDELERAYNYNQSSIRKTGKTYTTDSRKYDAHDEKFSAQIIEEYSSDDGKKYVRVKANSYKANTYYDGKFILSNGERYKDGDYVWVEVQPHNSIVRLRVLRFLLDRDTATLSIELSNAISLWVIYPIAKYRCSALLLSPTLSLLKHRSKAHAMKDIISQD